MIYYAAAANGTTMDRLADLRFRILITPQRRTDTEMKYAIDNGAWANGGNCNLDAFSDTLNRYGYGADWAIAPDVVCGGMESLALSVEWAPHVRQFCPVYLAVQNGMRTADIEPYTHLFDGIAVGGDTQWKEQTTPQWAEFARRHQVKVHVLRVNTLARLRLAYHCGVDSVDGSGVTKFPIKHGGKVRQWMNDLEQQLPMPWSFCSPAASIQQSCYGLPANGG